MPNVTEQLALLTAQVARQEIVLDDLTRTTDTVFVLCMAVLIFVMQAGFAMLEAGAVRDRSVRDVLLKNLVDASLGALAWFMCGYILASDTGGPFIGLPPLSNASRSAAPMPYDFTPAFSMVDLGADIGNYLKSLMYALTSATIVSGAVAERTQQTAYMASSIAITAVVYPVVVHWMWSEPGWLTWGRQNAVFGGAFDFAGGGVVHLTGGAMALIAAATVGPREGRFHHVTHRSLPMHGHSSALSLLGTFLLWIGWLAFNMGSVPNITAPGAAALAAHTAVRTTLAGSAGSITAVFAARCRPKFSVFRTLVWSLEHATNGLLAGLVSITAGAPTVSNWSALIIGMVGGLLYCIASAAVRRLMVDDVVDAFAVHGVCGAWSLLAVGLLADGSISPTALGRPADTRELRGIFMRGDGSLLAAQSIAVLCITAWSCLLGLLIFVPLNRCGAMRIPNDFELTGIDMSEFGRPAYESGGGLGRVGFATSNAVARPLSPTESLNSTEAAPAIGTPLDMMPRSLDRTPHRAIEILPATALPAAATLARDAASRSTWTEGRTRVTFNVADGV